MRKANLTFTERQVLDLLAYGRNYTEIALQLQKSAANIVTVCSHIRLKTGIPDTRDASACREWQKVNRTSFLQMEYGPTPAQREVLWMLGQGMRLGTIATLRGVKTQCVASQASAGRFRAGIKDNLPSAIRAYFQRQKEKETQMESTPPLNGDPCF